MNTTTSPTYYNYDGLNKARSSHVKLIATEGVVQKIRDIRDREGIWREWIALHIWREILDEYKKRAPGLKILSPDPIQLDESLKAITMSFLGGNDLQYLFKKKSKGVNIAGFNPEEHARQLGGLFAIKEQEKVKHGDLRLRHLLAGSTSPTNKDYLGLIDVESFRPVEIELVKREHQRLVNNLLMYGNSELLPFIQEGYEMVRDSTQGGSVVKDVTSDIKTRLGMPKGLNIYK